MRVAIVIGHNSKYQGAIGSLDISEWKFNSQLAEDIKESNYSGVDIRIFHRVPSKSYTKQMKILNAEIEDWGADLAIELHFNASIDEGVNGHEVLYCKGSKLGKKIAKVFDTNFDVFLTNADRNIKAVKKKNRGGGFVCRGKEPRILLEPFFASHQHLYKRGTEGYSRLLGAILISLTTISSL